MTLLGDTHIYEEPELQNQYSVPPIYREKNTDELPLGTCVFISALLHPTVAGLAWLSLFILALFGVTFAVFDKPQQPPKDIEFVLVNKEAEPINKNTPYRADRNSRAGGIHDPNRPVSMPTPAASPAPKQQAAQQPKAQPKKAAPQPPKQTQKTVQKQAPKMPWDNKPTPKPSVSKSVTKAPTQAPKPALKPSAPKVTQKPKGSFNVPMPKVQAPKLAGPASGPVGGSKTGSGARTSSPSPSFAPSGGGKTGGRFSSSGSGGSRGNVGNPGPGNPKGAPGIDALKEPDFGPYMRELQRRIKMNWEPPKGNESKRVVLLFRIGRDGRLLSNKVYKSSGLAVADNAAKAAVELTAPFKPLPPEYKGDSVDIQFTFDYNVFGATSYY